MNKPQGDSIWGTINACIEVSLNIYMIYAEYGRGIMIPKIKADEILSDEIINLGSKDGDFICFDEKTKDFPISELLDKIDITNIQEPINNFIENDEDYYGENIDFFER